MIAHVERPVARRTTQDPTPSEIARRAAAIRRNWSSAERNLRAHLASLYQLRLLDCNLAEAA
ncbi:MAG: hypothetical protein C0483_01690 [Pirellula sp.]|nr:hypothetical protein [Pirellula sp.]